MSVGDKCARDGCNRGTRKGGDEFCSRLCAQKFYGTNEASREVAARIRDEEASVERRTQDAMNLRLPGSFGSGKRR